MKEIPLDKGMTAFVDDEDYDFLVSLGPWHAAQRSKCWYARLGSGPYKNKYMHQLITGFERTDHENHNGLDNQRHNLRDATQPQNQANTRLYVTNTSGHKGVTWDQARKKWYASIMVNRKTLSLGRYTLLEDAIVARLAAEDIHQGWFAFNPDREVHGAEAPDAGSL